MTAAHHREAVGMMKEGGARFQRDRLFPRIDQIPIFFARWRCFAKTQNAIFSMIDHMAPIGLKSGNHFRKADTKINIRAVLQILCSTPCDLGISQFDFCDINHGYAAFTRFKASSC